MAAKFGIFDDEEHDSFPPKLHERPYMSRFIVTSSSCTTTELKKLFSCMQGYYQYRQKCILNICNFLLWRMISFFLRCAFDVV